MRLDKPRLFSILVLLLRAEPVPGLSGELGELDHRARKVRLALHLEHEGVEAIVLRKRRSR